MNSKKGYLLLLFVLIISNTCLSQLFEFEIGIPISANEKDADANGYYNSYTNHFILEQQWKGIITRLQYDSSFNLKNKYTISADSVTFLNSKKSQYF